MTTETDVVAPDLDAEQVDEHNARARNKLTLFALTVTQGEWLQVCRLLDMSRAQIGADEGITLLALAFVKHKRAGHGSMELLLELTDAELAQVHDMLPPPSVTALVNAAAEQA